MAKKKNIEDLKAGLTFGESKKVEEKQNEAPVLQEEPAPVVTETSAAVTPAVQTPENVPVTEQKKPVPGSGQSLAEIYKEKFQPVAEKRTERIQIVVTPTIAKKLDDLVAAGKIKSKNDLINFLLEGYLDNI